MVQLSGMSAVYGLGFPSGAKCSGDYCLVDLELGAEAYTTSFPDILSEPPEDPAGLGDSTLACHVNVGRA